MRRKIYDKLLQWKKDKNGTTALMIEGARRVGKSYTRHNISPIEVKSSTGYTLASIQKCIKKFGQYLSTPYVLHTKDVELNRRQTERHPSSLGEGRGAKEEGKANDGLVYMPLYITPLL